MFKARKLSIKPDGHFRDQFRTGGAPLTGSVLFTVRLPNTEWMWAHVLNALWALTIRDNWLKDGDVSIDDAIYASADITESFGGMIGAIFPVVWATLPDNFLLCDGSAYERENYPELYSLLDAAFIVDADNFVVPDLLGRVPVGESSDFSIGDTGGEIEHELIVGEMPIHSHTDTGHSHTAEVSTLIAAQTPVIPLPVALPGVGITGSASANLTDTGGSEAHNNMQPYQVIRYVICAR